MPLARTCARMRLNMAGTPCSSVIAPCRIAAVTSAALKRALRYRLAPAWKVDTSSVPSPKTCDIGMTA
ncbi:hypothetical protein D3C81_1639560 [compost metagenome]